jgi:hypothetical protein
MRRWSKPLAAHFFCFKQGAPSQVKPVRVGFCGLVDLRLIGAEF